MTRSLQESPALESRTTPATADNTASTSPNLASMFAIRAIRRRVLSEAKPKSHRDELIRLLELDPLTLLRCLRVACSPIAGLDRGLATIPSVVDALGRSFILRAFRVAEASHELPQTTHALWLHSIATATAARSLAATSEIIDPEQAYMRGLLRQLPRWLQLLDPKLPDAPKVIASTAASWNLPKALLDSGQERECDEAEMLFEAAEMLADLAEFTLLSDDVDEADRDDWLASITKESLVQARDLRRSVHRQLQVFGLGTTLPEPTAVRESPSSHMFWVETRGTNTDFIAGLLMCRQSSTYRSIVTVATSAALRYLDFDRATFIAWNRDANACFVKAKADFSIRGLEPHWCELATSETDILREAVASERPQLMMQFPDLDGPPGLLGLLGASEALLVMVNREFETPTFLVLDRTLSGRSIDLHDEATPAAVLGGTVAILTDNLRLRLQRIRAQKSAVTDPLTRLNNRAVGMVSLERELQRARREHLPLSVLMLDLDEFKILNDTHGHLVGDQALKITANVLRRTLRRSDVVCRYGGEEFLVVLPATAAEGASILAARLAVEVEASGKEYRLPLTVSIGLACLRDEDGSTDDIVKRADHALYASKSRGRNRFSVDPS